MFYNAVCDYDGNIQLSQFPITPASETVTTTAGDDCAPVVHNNKRKRNEKTWGRNARILLRNTGQSMLIQKSQSEHKGFLSIKQWMLPPKMCYTH